MYIFTLVVCLVMIWFGYHIIKYRNPYKLYMVFGRKGSGKTTLMTKLALMYQKKGFKVYCNTEIPGCYLFDVQEFGLVHFPENSLILIDEVNLIWDNRDFKNFPKHIQKYFRLQRHYKHVVYLFSQTFDTDKKIRDLCDHLYLVQNFMNCFSVARRVTKHITIVHADKSAQGESKIVDDYKIDPIWLAPFGAVRFTYIPKYAKFFKSFDPPQLQPKEFKQIPFPEKFRNNRRDRFEFMKNLNKKHAALPDLEVDEEE